jgi:hypothetical protein
MRSPARALLALVVVLVTALAGLGAPAHATGGKQRVYGGINCPRLPRCPNMKVMWFDQDWSWKGTARANGGGYSLRLAPGRYHLQFIDQRPAYDTSKYAPTDITVTVGRHAVSKSVTMKPGAAITGVARAGGKPLRNARIVAANKSEQSFATTADKKGRFAVGGLPAGKYCLFTYDKAKKYVGKCTWAGGVDYGQVKDKPVTLSTRAGNLTVFVDTRNGGNAPKSSVTVTSRASGQWWTTTVRSGKAVFRGLYPGRYTIKYDGGGIWLAASGAVRNGRVKSEKMAFGDFTVPKRGAWVSGTVVDSSQPGRALAGATVQLWSSDGTKLGEGISDDSGVFQVSGAIYTQSGVTIVVQPNQYSDYLGEEPYRCQYVRTEYPGYAVTENEETFVDLIGIDRLSPQDKPGCEA